MRRTQTCDDLPNDQDKECFKIFLILVVPSTIYGVEVEKLTNMDADFFTVQNWIVRNFGTLVICV